MAQLGLTVKLHTDFDTALQRVTNALKAEGFGVLTEIDVQATLKKKLDVDFRPYKILGACNPALAYRALSAAPEIGLLLPCNAMAANRTLPVEMTLLFDTSGSVMDEGLLDPLGMMGFVQHPDLEPVAEEARQRLDRVAKALSDE